MSEYTYVTCHHWEQAMQHHSNCGLFKFPPEDLVEAIFFFLITFFSSETIFFFKEWWQCFKVAFWSNLLIRDVCSCVELDSKAHAPNTTMDCVFWGLVEGNLWSCPRQYLVRCFLIAVALGYPSGAAATGTSLPLDSLGTALLVVTFWFFYFVEESLLSVWELMSSGDQSREDEDKSICCRCWEDCSKIFLWEEKFLAYFCHLLLVLTLMQEIFIL